MSMPLNTPDDDFLKRRQVKLSLLRRIYALLAQWRQEQRVESMREPSPQEKAMQALLGIILAVIGFITVVVLGLPQAFSPARDQSAVALFLIFGGELAALSGAWLTQYYYAGQARLGKLLFGIGFIISVVVIIAGLSHIFSEIGAGVFLLIVGFIGAFLS